MKKILVKCHKLSDDFEGICKYDNRNVYVKDLLIGEEAIIEVFNENENTIKGNIVEYKVKNPNRRKVKCNYFDNCGGCNLMHLQYDYQTELKHQFCKDKLKQYSNNLETVIFKAKEQFNYRNKVISTFKRNKKNKITPALYEEHSKSLVSVNNCMIQNDLANRILDSICDILNKLKISIYGEKNKNGVLKFVLIRIAEKTNEALVCFVVNSDIFPARNEIVKELRFRHKEIKTIVQNTNNRDTSIVLGDKERVLFGNGYIVDELCGYKFKITSKSFYQINHDQTEVLYKNAIDSLNLNKNDIVLDAYSGIGTIGIILSNKVKEVFSVELNRDSFKNAIENSKLNNVRNVTFYNADATEFICSLEKTKENKIDVVIMDPPRDGSTKEFLNSVIELKPKKVLYISCNVLTLQRDLEVLKKDYTITKLFFVDLFCNTFHTECVCLLELKK